MHLQMIITSYIKQTYPSSDFTCGVLPSKNIVEGREERKEETRFPFLQLEMSARMRVMLVRAQPVSTRHFYRTTNYPS